MHIKCKFEILCRKIIISNAQSFSFFFLIYTSLYEKKNHFSFVYKKKKEHITCFSQYEKISSKTK